MVNALISRQALFTCLSSLVTLKIPFTIHYSLFTIHYSLLNMLFLYLKNLISISIIDECNNGNMRDIVNTAQ